MLIISVERDRVLASGVKPTIVNLAGSQMHAVVAVLGILGLTVVVVQAVEAPELAQLMNFVLLETVATAPIGRMISIAVLVLVVVMVTL